MLSIREIYTMHPDDIWTPRRDFLASTPFGIMMIIDAATSLVTEGRMYELVFQMVNPRDDPSATRWYVQVGNDFIGQSTLDFHKSYQRFKWSSFYSWIGWNHYVDAIYGKGILGPGRTRGVFSVRGSISVYGQGRFDITEPHAFNYVVL
jgi:hypothetical protein